MVWMRDAEVQLRPGSADDAEARFSLGTNADIARMFGVSQQDVKPMSWPAAQAWANDLAKNQYAWAIEVDGQLVGEIKLHSMNAQDRRASMAVAIYDPEHLGKGYGSAAIRLLLRHSFTDLDLHRISIRVLAYNERAVRAYQKCGFVMEGRERETAFLDGKWHDDLMMGMLSSEFQRQLP